MITLRNYQSQAIEAAWNFLSTKNSNPCVVLPTGSGKTVVLAALIKRTVQCNGKVLVLSHVKELLVQDAAQILSFYPECPIGLYSAGLKSRQISPVTVAGIQSVYSRAEEFGKVDMVMIDECHHLGPPDGDGIYIRFLADLRKINPDLRVAGFTATPFRLRGGPICGPDLILNEICYEANVRDLIEGGWLSRLTTKGGGKNTIDVTGVEIRSGEFVAEQLEEKVNRLDLVRASVADAVSRLEGRKSIAFFCVSVAHAESVAGILRTEHGIPAAVVSQRTPSEERAKILADFKAGTLRAVSNVNILSEGFDHPGIDAIVCMRPTASPGLHYQQIGRGLRIAPGKTDVLVLDYAGNTIRHGPIDRIRPPARGKGAATDDRPKAKECPNCLFLVPLGTTTCPECGFAWPEKDVEHERMPWLGDVVSNGQPTTYEVGSVSWNRHEKEGRPDSVRINWFDRVTGRFIVSEWLCFEHEGFAAAKARQWWSKRFDGARPPETVEAALQQLDSGAGKLLESLYTRIEVDEKEKYPRVRKHLMD